MAAHALSRGAVEEGARQSTLRFVCAYGFPQGRFSVLIRPDLPEGDDIIRPLYQPMLSSRHSAAWCQHFACRVL